MTTDLQESQLLLGAPSERRRDRAVRHDDIPGMRKEIAEHPRDLRADLVPERLVRHHVVRHGEPEEHARVLIARCAANPIHGLAGVRAGVQAVVSFIRLDLWQIRRVLWQPRSGEKILRGRTRDVDERLNSVRGALDIRKRLR